MNLPPLPKQPAGTPWPTQKWPRAVIKIDRLTDPLFTSLDTYGLLIVKEGRIVFERYGEHFSKETVFRSWSMAKSITHALIGLLVKDKKIDIFKKTDVKEWQTPGDPRQEITFDHLLRMSSGLEFNEVYTDTVADTVQMLFLEGQNDMAHFAASKPLIHPPGTFWSYSSGTTNIITREAAKVCGKDFKQFMQEALFLPLGMKSPNPLFDGVGTFVGSSFCDSTLEALQDLAFST